MSRHHAIRGVRYGRSRSGIHQSHELPFASRCVWFLIFGWWAGLFVAGLGTALVLSIIGSRAGMAVLQQLPQVITGARHDPRVALVRGHHHLQTRRQVRTGPRLLYTALVGWWLAIGAIGLSYLLIVSVVGIPLAALILANLDTIGTLYRR